MHSLRVRLVGLWGLSLVACVTVGFLFLQLYRRSTAAQAGRAEAVVARACDLIRDRFGFYAAGWSGPQQGQFDETLRADLTDQAGVEGGIWQAEAGPLAYAFPAYEHAVDRDAVAGTQTLPLHACPLPGPIGGLTGWTMTRVRAMRIAVWARDARGGTDQDRGGAWLETFIFGTQLGPDRNGRHW